MISALHLFLKKLISMIPALFGSPLCEGFFFCQNKKTNKFSIFYWHKQFSVVKYEYGICVTTNSSEWNASSSEDGTNEVCAIYLNKRRTYLCAFHLTKTPHPNEVFCECVSRLSTAGLHISGAAIPCAAPHLPIAVMGCRVRIPKSAVFFPWHLLIARNAILFFFVVFKQQRSPYHSQEIPHLSFPRVCEKRVTPNAFSARTISPMLRAYIS